MTRSSIAGFCCYCLLSLLPLQVYADSNEALMQLLRALHKNGTINDETYSLIRRTAGRGGVNTAGEEAVRMEDADDPAVAASESGGGQGNVQSGSFNEPTVEVGGRIQADAALYDEDRQEHNNGTEMRRVRLFARGELGDDWAYKLQYDFVGSGIEGIRDAYIDYTGSPRFRIRMGHFKEPFSLQNMTSSKYVTFIERGLPHVFTQGRNIGIQASTKGDNWSLAGGFFGEGLDGAGGDEDEGYGASGRFTWLPFREDSHLLHLGASLSWRSTGSADAVRFRERPESHVTDTRIVDTGTFDADSLFRVVGEAAYVNGPVALQGEYYHTTVDRDLAGNPDTDFDGYYAEASWFATGESLNYLPGSGSFGRVTPDRPLGSGGWGAWQLAARFSHLDLTDADIHGGKADNVTFGINWFPHSHLRFSANYVHVLDVRGGPGDGEEPRAVTLRGQVEF